MNATEDIGEIASKKRIDFWKDHLFSAQIFAQMSAEIEEKYEVNKSVNKFLTEGEMCLHRSYVINSVISSALFMEARINEIFSACADKDTLEFRGRDGTLKRPTSGPLHYPSVPGLTEETIAKMAFAWDLDVPRTAKYKILDKYQIALKIAGQDEFDTGLSLYQNVALVVKLRNHLVHSEPETIYVKSPNQEDLKEHEFMRLLKGKFNDSPFASHRERDYAVRLFGSSCAKWAVTSATMFVDEFQDRIGITTWNLEECRVFPCPLNIS